MTGFFSSLIILAMTMFVAPVHAKWFDNSWSYRIKLTVDANQVNGDLSNFPIYVNLNDLNGTGFFTNVSNGGGDIRVTKSNGAALVAHDVVDLDRNLKTGELHFVANGTLSGTSNSDWYLYYGNPLASEPSAFSTFGSNNVWSNNYVSVWHMNEDPSLDGSRQFTSASSEYFTRADNADLSTGDIDFTIAAWVNFDTLTGNHIVVAKGNIGATAGEFGLRASFGNGFYFNVSNGAAVTSINTSLPETGRWYFLTAWHDATGNTLNLQIDNGTIASQAYSGGVQDVANAFRFGDDTSGARYLDGRLSKIGFWKRTLTAAERTWLYNTGKGRLYGELGNEGANGVSLKTSLISYWNLNEASGNAIDSHGANNLTDTNSVTASTSTPASTTTINSAANTNDGTLTDMDFLNAWSNVTPDGTGEPRIEDSSSNGNHGLMFNADMLAARVQSSPHNTFNARINDASGNGNHGMAFYYLENGNAARQADVVAGANGNSMKFDGNNQYIEISNESKFDDTSSFSISAWVKRNGSTGSWQGVISKTSGSTNGWGILFDNSAADNVEFWTPNGRRYVPLVAGWNHVVVVYDSAQAGADRAIIYLNGVLTAGTATGGAYTLTANNLPLRLGAESDGSIGQHIDANLDEIRFYDDLLSNGEALYLYNSFRGVAGGTDPGTANLVAHWDFEESNLHNLPALGNGRSMVFDGDDDHIKIEHSDSVDVSNGDMTICGWFKTGDSGAQDYVAHTATPVSTSNVRWRLLSNAGTIAFEVDDNVSAIFASATLDVADNAWHHFCGTRDSSDVKIFVDTIEVGSANASSTGVIDNNHPIFIGARTDKDYFNGSADDIRLYKGEAKSASQILSIYNGANDTNGLVGHWKFDRGARDLASVGPGSSLDFDGDNDVVRLGSIGLSNPLALNGSAGTVAVWINQDSGGDTYQRIYDKSNGGSAAKGYALVTGTSVGSERGLLFLVNGTTQYGTTAGNLYEYGEWTHVAVTWDALGNPKFYTNAVEVPGSYLAGSAKPIPNMSTNGAIGSWNHASAREFGGKIDDLRIYSTQKTADEIVSIYYGADDSTNIVGHWKFDDGPNVSSNDSGPANNFGRSSGAMDLADLVNGQIGKALEFDGTNDFIKFPNSPEINKISSSVATVSAWYKTSSSGASKVVFNTYDASDGLQSWIVIANQASTWSDTGSTLSGTTNVTDGSWYYVTGTWDGTNSSIYVNNVRENNAAKTFSPTTRDNQIGAQCSGANSTTCTAYFPGKIDEVRFSSVSRAANWIDTEYNNQSSPSTFYVVGSQESQGGLFDWHLF